MNIKTLTGLCLTISICANLAAQSTTYSDPNGGSVTINPSDGCLEIGSGNDGYSFIDFKGKTHLAEDYWGRFGYDDNSGFQLVRMPSANTTTLSTYSLNANNYIVMYAGLLNDANAEISFERTAPSAGNIYFGGNSRSNIIFRSSGYSDRMFISADGGVGIGTRAPTATLDVRGTVSIAGATVSPPSLGFNEFNVRSWKIGAALSSSGKFSVQNGSTGLDALTIDANSNVGIGTTQPTHKLTVSGTIRAKEIVVDSTGWADFVFEKGRKVSALPQVENFIKECGHLPGIPTAKEIDDNGISLGALQGKLLEKIEELFLHQIEMEKRLHQLEAENAALKERLTSAGN
ncbi:hypothetical protein [Nibricoccus sp. IMCC34717]|uniref:hypothetical protein n=1 Tax=Nibricoccus sp. IMCC34717 TaxID=3034021 RepID=UPI00384BE51A